RRPRGPRQGAPRTTHGPRGAHAARHAAASTPVKIPSTLPARATLERENVFVMGEERAARQDIRPMRVAILNLMPTTIATETQLLRLLGNSALQVDVTLLHTATHESKNVDAEHLLEHYTTFERVRDRKFDGLI